MTILPANTPLETPLKTCLGAISTWPSFCAGILVSTESNRPEPPKSPDKRGNKGSLTPLRTTRPKNPAMKKTSKLHHEKLRKRRTETRKTST